MQILRRSRRITALLAASALLAGCGLLGDDPDPEVRGDPGVPEQAVVRVEGLDVMDAAPLHLGMKNGNFKREGLEIKLSVGKGGSDNVAKLASGETDIAFSSYSPFFIAQAKGAADIKLISDGSSAPAGTQMIVAGKNSPVKNVHDLPGKRFGVTNIGTMSQFLPMSRMQELSVDYSGIQWIETQGFPAMQGLLASGEIDAAYLTQPFLAKAEKEAGVLRIIDTTPGIGSATSRIPLTGYGATAEWVRARPRTVAAFQRAMAISVIDASANRAKVEEVIVEKIRGLSHDDVKMVGNLPLYGSILNPLQLQRIPDLMLSFKGLPRSMDAASMLAPYAQVSK